MKLENAPSPIAMFSPGRIVSSEAGTASTLAAVKTTAPVLPLTLVTPSACAAGACRAASASSAPVAAAVIPRIARRRVVGSAASRLDPPTSGVLLSAFGPKSMPITPPGFGFDRAYARTSELAADARPRRSSANGEARPLAAAQAAHPQKRLQAGRFARLRMH